jgi:hypothetical protein
MKKVKKHIPLSQTLPDVRRDFGFYDQNQRWLIGWPGYRTREEKSGLGYLDTQAEWAHIQGLWFRKLITGKFQTRNPIYWVCLALYGLISVSPVLLLFVADTSGRAAFFSRWALFTPDVLLGFLLLLNLLISLFKYNPADNLTGD